MKPESLDDLLAGLGVGGLTVLPVVLSLPVVAFLTLTAGFGVVTGLAGVTGLGLVNVDVPAFLRIRFLEEQRELAAVIAKKRQDAAEKEREKDKERERERERERESEKKRAKKSSSHEIASMSR